MIFTHTRIMTILSMFFANLCKAENEQHHINLCELKARHIILTCAGRKRDEKNPRQPIGLSIEWLLMFLVRMIPRVLIGTTLQVLH